MQSDDGLLGRAETMVRAAALIERQQDEIERLRDRELELLRKLEGLVIERDGLRKKSNTLKENCGFYRAVIQDIKKANEQGDETAIETECNAALGRCGDEE